MQRNLHQSTPSTTIQEPSSVYTKTNPQMFMEEPPPIRPSGVGPRDCRVNRWVEAQNCQVDERQTEDGLGPSSNCHPYLAYPQLNLRSKRTEQSDYALAYESDGPTKEKVGLHSIPTRHTSGILNASSTLRNLRLSFSSSRRAATVTSPSHGATSWDPGLSNLNMPRTASQMTPSSRRPQSAWNVASKLRRPGVDRSAPTATKDAPVVEQSRPSFSSNSSYSTGPSLDSPSAFGSGSSPISNRKASPSLWSLPSSASHLNDPPGSTKLLSQSSRSTIRVFSLRHPGHNSSGHASSLLSRRLGRKKKYLVISGIGMDDQLRFELAKQWCESFGELRSIWRAPNGDIHVDFCESEVADTVCRVQAQVTIAGIGSVRVSWYTG